MTDRPLLLDLFCCQGGAAVGYSRAGFDVIGVDIEPQPRYPFTFEQADALDYLREEVAFAGRKVDAIHASPPCQHYSAAQKLRGREHPDLIPSVRAALVASGIPWVIENVPGAPLLNPVVLCGTMFGLPLYRHRHFESNVALTAPAHPPHIAKRAKMGRRAKPDEFMTMVGNFSGVERARGDMDVAWMNRDGIREAIPPAYTQHIGAQLLAHIRQAKAA